MIGSAHRNEAFRARSWAPYASGREKSTRCRPRCRGATWAPTYALPAIYGLRKLASIGQRNAAQAPSVWLSETSDRDSCRAELRAVGWTAAGAALHAFILTCACRRLLRTRFGNAALIPAGYLNYVPNLLNTLVCDQVIRPVTWRHSNATAPQLRDVEVPSGQAGDRALLLLPQGRRNDRARRALCVRLR
jgi:hypothetical protein